MSDQPLPPPTIQPRAANVWRTIGRLWPSFFTLPLRVLRHGRDGICFVHPQAIVRGHVRYGRYCEVGASVFLNAGPEGIAIGVFSQINPHVSLIGNIEIGDRVLIAPGAVLAAGGHRFGKGIQPRFCGGSGNERIVVGDDCWIGANATIVGDITIGAGCVIAAGAVVDRDVPPETLVRRAANASITLEPLR